MAAVRSTKLRALPQAGGEEGLRSLGVADDTWDRRSLGEALRLHEKLERAIAAAAGRNIEHARLGALGIEKGPDMEALDQAATGDRGRQVMGRDAVLPCPDVGLGKDELVEGDVARRRQGDFLIGSSRRDLLRDRRTRASLDLQPASEIPALL